MKLNTNLLIGAALLGGGAYVAYQKGWFGLGKKLPPMDEALKENQSVLDKVAAEKAKKDADDAAAAAAANAIKQANTITNPKSYAGKVSYIQSEIHVTPDGIPGAVTNKAYAAIYGLDKGNISTANIDYYKSKVEQRLTLSKQNAVAKQTNGVAVVNALKNGGTIRFIKTINAQNFVLNKATNSYVATGTNLLFNSGAVLGSGWKAIDRGAGFVLIYKTGANTLQQVPVNAIVVI